MSIKIFIFSGFLLASDLIFAVNTECIESQAYEEKAKYMMPDEADSDRYRARLRVFMIHYLMMPGLKVVG